MLINPLEISIHAPPRGATKAVRKEMKALIISIHAPPRGATYADALMAFDIEFQFTPLREGRRNSHCRCAGGSDFNSRPSARGDSPPTSPISSGKSFQFTPLREGRQRLHVESGIPHLFQFTPLREGRPTENEATLARYLISIHAPPRGATP